MRPYLQFLRISCLLAALLFSIEIATAQVQPKFNIVKPSTTGIPGEEVRIMKFDPAGNLWVFGRHYFWGEVGLAMLSADQLPYEPLPGGGFDTDRWKVWSNVHHPIPSPYGFDLAFSADGQTLWLATEGGLTRFRPNASTPQEMWKTWNPSNSPMTIMGTTSVAVDQAGNVWVVANNVQNYPEAKLHKFNPTTEQWTTHAMPVDDGEELKPYAISVARNGDILASIRTWGGLARFNGTTWKVMPPNGGGINTPLEDPQGNIWGGGVEGVWRWNGTAWKNWTNFGGESDVTVISLDRDGIVNVGAHGGKFYKMINNQPVYFLDGGPQASSFVQRASGDIWIHQYGGAQSLGTVRHHNASGQLLERFTNYNAGLGDYFVNRIKSDSQGNMWFASGEAGLVRMTGSNGAPTASTKWRAWGNHNDASEPYPWAGNEPMYSVFEEGNGIFWMGGNGVGRWDSSTGQFTNFWNWQNSAIDVAGVTAIAKRGNTMWVGSGYSGCFWLNGNTWTRVQLSEPWAYSSNNVRAMTVDTAGNLWVASEFGLRKFAAGDNANYTLYHQDNSSLVNGGLNDVEADPAGGIWVATYGGLSRFNGSTWTSYTQSNTGMPGVNVTDVARRPSDGLIAISSIQSGVSPYTGGVSTFDGTTWKHYTPQNSPLTHWQVAAVEFDRDGNLWASATSQGLVQIMVGSQPIHSITKSGNQVSLSGKGVPGQAYVIKAANDLSQNFVPAGSSTANAEGVWQFQENPPAGSTRRFYRAFLP